MVPSNSLGLFRIALTQYVWKTPYSFIMKSVLQTVWIKKRTTKHNVRNHKLSLHINNKRVVFFQAILRTIGINHAQAPVLWSQIFDNQGRRMPLNAYALDFYKHGSLTGLVQDNGYVFSIFTYPPNLSTSTFLSPCLHSCLCLHLSLSFLPLPLVLFLYPSVHWYLTDEPNEF